MRVTENNQALLLMALYNNARTQGRARIQYQLGDMPEAEALSILGTGATYFDYVYGRVLKIDLAIGQDLDFRLYDRDNGSGAGELACRGLEDD